MALTAAEYDARDGTGLADLVRRREVTALELLEVAAARIERTQPVLNTVLHRFEDHGRALIAQGLPQGPFTGVPFLLKGTGAALAGLPLTNGSALLRGNVAGADSTLGARYLAAGLVPIGRTNVPEFALSLTTEPLDAGPTRNPWDTRHSSGGSSGGAAAAVAAGIVPMAHAADGGGSIRVPASHCGVFGFKPTRMRNPGGPEIAESIAGMGTPHAVTRSVRDSAALLDATSGPDLGDPYVAPASGRFADAVGAPVPRLRIGLVLDTPLGTPIDPACRDATTAAAALCESLGHDVATAPLPHDAASLGQAWRTIAGVNLVRPAAEQARRLGLADPAAAMEPVNATWLREGQQASGADYLAAVNQVHRAGRDMARFFETFDVLLSPATATPAPPLGWLAGPDLTLDTFFERFWTHAPFAPIFNAAGCPAMSVPLAWSAAGLPVGVQFGAAYGQDALLFALAGQLEQARPWFDRRPPA